MKYIAPSIVVKHNALTAILGGKFGQPRDDSNSPIQRSTTAGYESDE